MKNKFYITTSIAYVNSAPHVGFALELVQSDVLARFYRQKGVETFFLTGTDEHGAKIARAAEAAGKESSEFVDENTVKFKKMAQELDISFDNFIRTSDQKSHWPAAEKIWQRLKERGDLYLKTYKGLYCVGHEAFVTEKDLVKGKCDIHGTAPEIVEEENWFFRLSKYEKEIREALKNERLKIIPKSRKNEMLGLIKGGLEDVSFSRPSKDLAWGIPVPDDPSQTMYVWADALTNYLSGIGFPEKGEWEKWWPADWHIVGKDITRFHALIWPGMLLAAGLELPKTIAVHGFITSGGEKMSKSIGNVVDPFEIIKVYGADALRYYLLREIPSTEDGDFTEERFKERYNADLVNGLGNTVSRIVALSELAKKAGIKIVNLPQGNLSRSFIGDPKDKIKNFNLHEALSLIWEGLAEIDKGIEQTKLWELVKKDKEKAFVINTFREMLWQISHNLFPFLPGTSRKIMEQLKTGKREILFPRTGV